ncbi:hypothetical protein EVJ58_g11033 [Rhodofomes roseus]|uniref:Uncharacterized protein n=1 Tax=Rhodofomes roseus TaxID=34475 RepID=A0A4Y9XPN5_9APHY|nr:hypothetical protein EVJ58_g11033 [Rhodofomes roseus]
MTQFGDFAPLCHTVPSYPWCNLFYRQIVHANASLLANASANATEAPVGVNPQCGILRVGADGSIGNVANIVVCGVSILFTALLIVWTSRRRAAVGECLSVSLWVLVLFCRPRGFAAR